MVRVKRYYRVEVLAGHCAHANDEDVLIFYFAARNIIEATTLARRMPGVKHDRTNAICSVKEITKDEYSIDRQISAYEVRNNPTINR